MPPKNKKELELEAQKLAEEEHKREEEERLRKEEERKKLEIKTLDTGLQCVFNDFYVTECFGKSQDPRQFTREYLCSFYFKERGILQNFRPIDWTVLVDFMLYNLRFAKIELNMSDQQTKVFLNIMFEILSQNDPKYSLLVIPKNKDDHGNDIEFDEQEKEKYISQQLRQQGRKSQDGDFTRLKQLLANHSIDMPPNKQKYFTSEQLSSILQYASKTYFVHYALYSFVQRREQRQIDQYQTAYVDYMTDIPPLEQGVFVPLDKKDEEQLERERRTLLKQQLDEEEALELEKLNRRSTLNDQQNEEDDLDPLALEIIREKIKETELLMQKQLDERQLALNEKLQEIDKPKKGIKK